MKVVIFAGGYGTRISAESVFKPKPLIEIGGKPILWHIMKYYTSFGFNDFVILGGYKQELIKKYFEDYFLANCDVSFKYGDGNRFELHQNNCEKWNVTVPDTGLETMTGGRLRQAKKYLGKEPFMLTYGDGLSDVDLNKLLEIHKKTGALVTLTAVQPAQQFGTLKFGSENHVTCFAEKVKDPNTWINGGYFVVDPKAIDYIDGDSMPWEETPLKTIAEQGKLSAYKHTGFWKCMDTLKDKSSLEEVWAKGKAPWKVWN